MRIPLERFHPVSSRGTVVCLMLVAIWLAVAPARAQDGFTRFSFGFGVGLKQFLSSRLAIRAEAQWLPILVDPSVSGFACGTIQFGGCLVVLSGELVQQLQLSIGPVVRF
jgi:hypothetical protein